MIKLLQNIFDLISGIYIYENQMGKVIIASPVCLLEGIDRKLTARHLDNNVTKKKEKTINKQFKINF